MVSSSSTAPNTLKSHFAMSVLGTGPKWRRGQRSGAVSVWPGGIRAGSTPSGTRLLLKNEATAGSIGSAGILPFQASETMWARGAAGSARESHSRGQGFESPRVHQRPHDANTCRGQSIERNDFSLTSRLDGVALHR